MGALFLKTEFDILARIPRIITLPNMDKTMAHLKLGRNVKIAMADSRIE